MTQIEKKKKEILSFATTEVNLEVIILIEGSQIERELSYGIKQICKTYELIYKMETGSET